MYDLIDHAEDFAKLLSVVTGAAGLWRTAADILQRRSRDSRRDKNLILIQGLMAARVALHELPSMKTPESVEFGVILDSQIAGALGKVALESCEVDVKERAVGRIGLIQRLLLLYRPPTSRAWIPQLMCWICELVIPMLVFSMFFATDGEGGSVWVVFVRNFKNPSSYFTFLFLMGLFLLFRSWGVWERNRYLRSLGLRALPLRGFRLRSVAAVVYGLLGVTVFIVAATFVRDDLFAVLKMGLVSLVTFGCGLQVYVWGAKDSGTEKVTVKKAVLLSIPVFLAIIVSVFDTGGIVSKAYFFDPIGYWRSWLAEPAIPLYILAFLLLPAYGSISCLSAAINGRGKSDDY